MVIKLSRRKHMAAGSRLARARICEEYTRGPLELHVPHLLCPVCQLWPAIRQRTAVGEPLSPGTDREEGALGAPDFRWGAELATRR